MRDIHDVYGRRELLLLYSNALASSHNVQSRLRSLGLWTVCRLKAGRVYRYRGRQAGRQCAGRCQRCVVSTTAPTS